MASGFDNIEERFRRYQEELEEKAPKQVFIPLSGERQGSHQVIPECEVDPEGGESLDTLDAQCEKNPDHDNFIPVSEFKLEHIPPDLRRDKVMDYIQYFSALTVRAVVGYTSKHRPDTFADSNGEYPYIKFRGSRRKKRYGTGRITSIYDVSNTWEDFGDIPPELENQVENCPCKICKKSGNPEKQFWTVKIHTAAHVIFDDDEAENTEFECFYDSESNREDETVKTIYGFKILDQQYTQKERWRLDFAEVACVTHDRDLVAKIEILCMESRPKRAKHYEHNSNLGIMISHPHGRSKKITIGRMLHVTETVNPEKDVFFDTIISSWTLCRLPLYPWSNYYSGPVNDGSPLPLIEHGGLDKEIIYDTIGEEFLSECNSTLVEKFVYPIHGAWEDFSSSSRNDVYNSKKGRIRSTIPLVNFALVHFTPENNVLLPRSRNAGPFSTGSGVCRRFHNRQELLC